MTTSFWTSGPGLIESDLGSIRLRGRAGLEVTFEGRRYDVSSEMLAPPRSIVVYPRDSGPEGLEDTGALVAFVIAGLEWDGFTVELG